ncbi:MAG: TolC family protein [Pirellulales bacterium]|nr:TolC family protein [Pirellulales bacterium]
MIYRMCFRSRFLLLLALLAPMALSTGCSPAQPFYFGEDGDLSHYVGMATNIEFPDAETCSLQEVDNPPEPLTVSNPDAFEPWDLKLEDAVRIALQNGKVMRSLGLRVFGQQFNVAQPQINAAPDVIQRQPKAISTVYDVAITEADPIFGPEGALSQFDPQLSASMVWDRNNRPQNVKISPTTSFFQNRFLDQSLGTFQEAITKRAATGAEFAFRNNLIYNDSNQPFRDVASDWSVNFEASVRQPLLQGAGSQFNRIAGPFDPLRGIGTYLQYDGIVIARLRVDQRLADFEAGVRDFVADVEQSYWELYFSYRFLEAAKSGRDSALQTWKKVHALFIGEAKGGEADKEAQAREQYFFFRSQVETAQANLFRSENRLRFQMGLAATDGRLIRPADPPTDARVRFDYTEIHAESLVRSVELRQQKWLIKQKEMELLASKNLLLPRLDAIGTYRWLGLGHDLLNYPGQPFTVAGPISPTDAFSTLASGKYQEWEMGLQANMPIGFRQPLAAVRNQQLQLARERAVLQEQELELSHQLTDDFRSVDTNYNLTETNLNRRVAAERQVQAVQAAYDAGTVTLDLLLEAQRRRADAEAAYYRTLVDYNKAIMFVHFRKGSLLEYNGVYLAEGPWPAKAYFDATRRARARDAGIYMDYGFTRPAVVSRGPFEQFQNTDGTAGHEQGEPTMAAPEDLKGQPTPAMQPNDEELPTPPVRTGQGSIQGPQLMDAGRPIGKPLVKASANPVADERTVAGTAKRNHAGAGTMKVRGLAQPAELQVDPAAKNIAALRPTEAPAHNDPKVQLTSAEEAAPFDWGAMGKLKAPDDIAANSTPTASAASNTWKSPNAGAASDGGSGGWKSAR